MSYHASCGRSQPGATSILSQVGGGFEIETWSHLPHRSGLGTQSILAAALITSVGAAAYAARFDATALTHIVLQVEQYLTTGVGWQDQIGGSVGGVKLCTTAASLPLSVGCERLLLSTEARARFVSHLQLVYTGFPQPPSGVLNDMLRDWALGCPRSANEIEGLAQAAEQMAAALSAADVRAIGRALAMYWEHKKRMCDAEPPVLTRVLRALYTQRLIHGACLADAGGGGFLVLITTAPSARSAIEAAIGDVLRDEDAPMSFHDVTIDDVGLVLEVDHDGQAERTMLGGGQPSGCASSGSSTHVQSGVHGLARMEWPLDGPLMAP